MTDGPYELVVTATALRALSAAPPGGVGERIAWVVYEFIQGPLVRSPYRVGKPLVAPLTGTFSARRGSFRVLYEVDEDQHTVTVTAVQHRSDAYRRR